MNDTKLDAAIDRAVREMTSVEPRAEAEARMRAVLRHPPRRTVRWTPLAAVGAAAIAALVIAAFAIVAIVDRPEPVSTRVAVPDVTAPPPEPPAALPQVRSAAETTAPPQRVVRAGRRALDRVQAATLPDTIPALDTIDPLVIEIAVAGDIEPPPVVVPAVTAIPEITIAPLAVAEAPSRGES
jgi:hypothetical protein